MNLTHSTASTQWKRVGVKHYHGVDIPVFSLRSANSAGIGEFTDLIPLIDWSSSVQLNIIQLLPLNDCGLDPSPYNGISAFALNPIYIGVSNLPHLQEHPSLVAKLDELKKLDASQYINYDKVRIGKENLLREYYDLEGKNVFETESYQDFYKTHEFWLDEYALFKSLKIKNGLKNWTDWPEKRPKNREELKQLIDTHESLAYFQLFQQYLAYSQMTEVKKYANRKNIYIKGDIPILISPDSCDVWLYPEIFDVHFSAGAPPDMYSPSGQNWGFPIYNWEELKKENYFWWRQRLKTAEEIYDLYRIDHIVGFFRIWAIPRGKTALEGSFRPSDESTWIEHGRAILTMMLQASNMLPIGEDLGVIPPAARVCMREMGICGTKVIRWERYYNGDKSFVKFYDYPLESMTTVSTHDSEGVFIWWREHPEEARDFAKFMGWQYDPLITKDQRKELLWSSHRTNSLFHINLLQEYLSLIEEMAWPNPDDERINVPNVVSNKNWSYRFKPTIEEMIQNKKLQALMVDVIP